MPLQVFPVNPVQSSFPCLKYGKSYTHLFVYNYGVRSYSPEQRGLLLRMRFKEEQFSQKTIPKLVRTRERSTASRAPLQVVVD